MAIQLDPRLYTAGNVEFDSTPTVNLYGNILAKRQAKMDALDQYDRARINNINPQGLRDVDRQGFDQRLSNVQSFYNLNKDKIRKGTTPEAFEYEKILRDVSSYVNQSKERTAKQNAAMKLYQDRLKQDGRIPDDFITELHVNDSPIDADGSQSLDITKWMSAPKPFNQQNYLRSFSDIKRIPGQPKYTPNPDNPLKLTETIEETFDDGGKQVIAARAADKYQNSYSFSEQVKAEVADPISRKKLEDIFKQEYGTSPSQMEDYATALTMSLIQPKLAKTKSVDNKDAIMKRQEAFREKMFNMAENGRNYRATLNQEKPGLGNYDIFGTYETNGTVQPKTVKVKIEDGSPFPHYEEKEIYIVPANKVDVNHKKLFGDVPPVVDENGNKYYIRRDDGDWEGKNGQVISRRVAAQKNMDQTSMNEVKRGRLERGLVPKTSPPAGQKTYKVGNKTLTADQIKKGAEKYKMSESEYLKSIGAQ